MLLIIFILSYFAPEPDLSSDTSLLDIVRSGNFDPNIHGYWSHASPEDFGYTGLDEAMDNAALQAAFDATQNLTLNNTTYNVAAEIRIDIIFGQVITGGNNTVIRCSSAVQRPIVIDFRGKNNTVGTTLNNIEFDGNNVGGWLVLAYSKLHTNNVRFKDAKADNSAGLYLNTYDEAASWGNWHLNDITVTNLHANNNGTVAGDAIGVSTGFLFYNWEYMTQPTNIIVESLNVDGVFGEDAQAIGLFSPQLNTEGSGLNIIVRNSELKNVQRRLLKGFISQATYENVTFHVMDLNHPHFDPAVAIIAPVVISTRSGATKVGSVTIRNCTVVGDYDDSGEEIDEIILEDVGDVTIEGTNFTNGADLEMGGYLGKIVVKGSSFSTGSKIGMHGAAGSQDGPVSLDTNNTYADSGALSGFMFSYVEENLTVSQKRRNSIIPHF